MTTRRRTTAAIGGGAAGQRGGRAGRGLGMAVGVGRKEYRHHPHRPPGHGATRRYGAIASILLQFSHRRTHTHIHPRRAGRGAAHATAWGKALQRCVAQPGRAAAGAIKKEEARSI